MIGFNEAEDNKNRIKKLWKTSGKDKTETSLVTPVSKATAIVDGVEYVLGNKTKAFCEAYVREGCNVRKAITSSGVSRFFANKILYHTKVELVAKEYIKALKKIQEKAIKKEFGYTALQSFKKLRDAQEMALDMKKFLVVKHEDAEGNKTQSLKIVKDNPDLPSFIRAEELKGKLYNLYKNDTDGMVGTIMNIVVNEKPTIGMKKIKAIEAEVVK